MTEATRRARKTLLRKHLTKEGVVTQKSEQVKFEGGNNDTEQDRRNK